MKTVVCPRLFLNQDNVYLVREIYKSNNNIQKTVYTLFVNGQAVDVKVSLKILPGGLESDSAAMEYVRELKNSIDEQVSEHGNEFVEGVGRALDGISAVGMGATALACFPNPVCSGAFALGALYFGYNAYTGKSAAAEFTKSTLETAAPGLAIDTAISFTNLKRVGINGLNRLLKAGTDDTVLDIATDGAGVIYNVDQNIRGFNNIRNNEDYNAP